MMHSTIVWNIALSSYQWEVIIHCGLRFCKTAIMWLQSCHCFDVMISPSFIAFAAKTLEMYYDVMKYATFSRGIWLTLCKTCSFHSILQRNLTFSLLTWLGSPIFSAPEPKAQVHYCDHALSVVRPSSVRPSSVRPSLTFHIFDFSSETTEQNSTKLDRMQELNILYQVCVFGPIGKTRWPPWPLIGWDIFNFFSETAEWNSTKLNIKQDLNVLYQVCVFRADRKNKMAALASDWLRHFRLLLWNHWTEFNETWQEARSQRPLASLCFRADRKNKMAALTSDWLRHFRLLLWNRLTEFNETWQEARSQCPLPSLCFSSRSEKQDGRPGLWLAETFSTSPLKPLNRIQQNLTGRKISTSSTKFVFFGPIRKTRWPPFPLIGWDIFDFSSETAERKPRKLDRKQDLNILYQVCVFRADGKNKMATLASDWLKHFRLLLWNRLTEFKETWQESRSQSPLPSLCFSGWSKKQDGCPGLWLAETFLTSPLKLLNGIQRNLTGSKILNSLYQVCVFQADE